MKSFFLFIIIVLGAALLVWYGVNQNTRTRKLVNSFADCIAAGNPVMESYPRQCRTPDGRTFVEEVLFDNLDLIRIFEPRPGSVISSPLTVKGEALGTWFFEASFPVRLLDGNERELAVAPAQAQGEWMTEEFVPFSVLLTFGIPTTPTGTLILERDNPSGLPEHAGELRVPVRFEVSGSADNKGRCIATGCSGQVCAEEEVITTCEFRPEYACFKTARCERQANGGCGWTPTAELRQCLEKNGVEVDEASKVY